MNEWEFRVLFFHSTQNRENEMLFSLFCLPDIFLGKEGRKYEMKGGREMRRQKEGRREKKMGGREGRKQEGKEGERLIIWRYISLSSNALKYDRQSVI